MIDHHLHLIDHNLIKNLLIKLKKKIVNKINKILILK
jgi:hypothetical protein